MCPVLTTPAGVSSSFSRCLRNKKKKRGQVWYNTVHIWHTTQRKKWVLYFHFQNIEHFFVESYAQDSIFQTLGRPVVRKSDNATLLRFYVRLISFSLERKDTLFWGRYFLVIFLVDSHIEFTSIYFFFSIQGTSLPLPISLPYQKYKRKGKIERKDGKDYNPWKKKKKETRIVCL